MPINSAVTKKRKLSPFWLLPVVALLITGWLLWQNYLQRGTTITINFQSADGIVPGRTPIRYQGVQIGTVEGIVLSDDYRTIRIRASIKNDMKDALRQNTKFWLVTPQASLAGVSGLDALVGGNYISMMPGNGNRQDNFTALDSQPRFSTNTSGLLLHLNAPDLGSLSIGSIVYYRKIPVGKVYNYSINNGNQGVVIDLLIDRRYSSLVKKDSRFWNVSGVDASFSLSGVNVKMDSLPALINGAIAFDSPSDSQPAITDDRYQLYPNLAQSHRGVKIQLDLPDGDNLTAGSTPLIYQGLQVGTLTRLNLADPQHVSGELIIDPSVAGLMRSETRIELHSPKIGLTDTSLSSLLTGDTLELVPGGGQPQSRFSVYPATQTLMHTPGSLNLRLKASDSYGIAPGQPVVLNGVTIGTVSERQLTNDGVSFIVSIAPDYRRFVHGNSKFVADSQIRVNVSPDGIRMVGATPGQWLQGGIRLEAGDRGEPLSGYPLYADAGKADEGITGDTPSTTLTLTASSLPDIQAGSVVLYRRYQVGEIVAVTPHANNFEVAVHISPPYRNLITRDTVFWAEGGARVQINTSGITVQATPLNRALKGAISFDNMPGVVHQPGQSRTLFPSETAARAIGSQITLKTYDASKLSNGMPIRYLGITIGQIESLSLSVNNNQVLAKAVLYPEYVNDFARTGSRFSVISPEISSTGISHLDSLLQPYVNVEPGKGASVRTFELQQSTITDSRYLNGKTFFVDAPEAGSLTIGTPILFRGVEVGTVTGISLGAMADRVQIAMRISQHYQYLVRNNSIFWQASGYSLNFGLTGGVVKTGTFQQFIRGGIEFATPPTVPLAPEATANKHFLLLNEAPKNWQQWGTALPR